MSKLDNENGFETKAGGVDSGVSDAQINDAFDQFLNAFEGFKQTNDERLDALERRFGADVLLDEKLERINEDLSNQKQHLEHLTLKASRTPVGGGLQSFVASSQSKGFETYVRHGDTSAIKGFESKSLNETSNPDGGYLVPLQTETSVMSALHDLSPLRQICDVRTVSSMVYKKPFATDGFGSGWVGETQLRPETSTPTLDALTFQTMELYAMPAATQAVLEDSAVNIDQWLADEVKAAFSEQETTAFVVGTGVNQPRGFMDYTMVDNGSWTWGNLGTISTGVDGGFDGTDPGDNLIDLVYSLKASYRANGQFVMNRSTEAEIRKIKDNDGHYIWQPARSAGESSQLMGYPIVELEDMDDIDTGSKSVGFGDFKRGYLIVDRAGVRVLRDPFSSKPYVLFYTTKRVGGGVQDFDALKFLDFSA